MAYTVQEIHEMAIAVIDEISESGLIDPAKTKEYANRAPRLLNMWSEEWARVENITELEKLTSLDQTVQISDRNCPSGAYYLAQHYAIADMNDDLADICERKYNKLKAEGRVPFAAEEIEDVYNFNLTGGD